VSASAPAASSGSTGLPPRLIVIVGATGTGKSDLAIELAAALGGGGRAAAIVNADAMQLYRGMDIGTAKVPVAERRGIAHHLLDVVDPADETSVAEYQRAARARIEQLQADGIVPILVGGSGLYVSSVIHDFDFPARDPELRARLEGELAAAGAAALHARLAALDAAAAAAIDPANGRRIVRALEVVELTGAFTPGLPEDRAPWQPARIIGLGLERERLIARLDDRVEAMWASGLVEEALALRDGPGLGRTASRAIGYAQALGELDGRLSREEAIAETQALTRRYARRQVSWFRRYPGVAWLDAASPERHQLALAAAVGED